MKKKKNKNKNKNKKKILQIISRVFNLLKTQMIKLTNIYIKIDMDWQNL